jgi:hypothetical protein
MLTPQRSRLLCTAIFALAGTACGDSSGPDRTVDEDEIVAQCSEGTISSATSTQTRTGTLNAQDCQIRGDDGRIEGYRLPQAAYGTMTEVLIDLEAEFDAVIVITDLNGTILDFSDEDIGEDLGREQYVLPFDFDASEPEYFIVVYDVFGEFGDYTLRVGPVPEI